MQSSPSFKAVIFDFDGVIVEAREWHYKALNEALGVFGYYIDRAWHEQELNGLPTSVKLDRLLSFPQTLKPLVNDLKQKATRQLIEQYCAPDYQKLALFQWLKHEGVRIAIASNALPQTLSLGLSKLELLSYCDLVVSVSMVGKPKPAPDIYYYCFERLGVSAAETIIVEDSPYGIAGAQQTGAKVITVAGPRAVHRGLFE